MSYVAPFHAKMHISDPTIMLQAEAESWAHDQLQREMVTYADTHGLCDFDPEAVQYSAREDTATLERTITATWHPEDAKPIEIEGGAHDGMLVKSHNGMAHIMLPVVVVPQLFMSDGPVTVIPASAARYKLAGINPQTNRWVYIPE
ncbi:hypothetical protein [Cryobacterium sp. GrIS_2_6]|uniref:hypothetical protein n=1 Tax=Cryobacterium sp. GrIS_2_6 TaxID=3162785 RepID=UPI002DFE2479|nr:hypothetical protein [Cryobacterium psychrotolerans]MEC5149238.1 hypothetical protein [Cryobacterium psychrotolerans]MEC5149316.1 hypothetical protein [Cryobacterium psychrotolerans]